MNTKSITFVTLMALVTTLTLAGSIWVVLVLAGPNSLTRVDILPPNSSVLEVIAAFLAFLCGGGLWGFGIAQLTKTDVETMVKACALSWGVTAFIFSLVLGLSLGRIFQFASIISFRYHYYFLLILVPVVGIVTGINARVVAGKLQLPEIRNMAGLRVGITSAAGFLAAGLILQYGFGWEVGKPVLGKYGMLTILQWCNLGAALAGGAVLGMVLVKERLGADTNR